jgi:hypothetical protein
MSFKRYATVGKSNTQSIREYSSAVSTTLTTNSAVATDSSGYLIPATSSTAAKFVGVYVGPTVTTDSSTHATCQVDEDPLAVWVADTGADTAQAQIGLTYDLTDSVTVNNAATSVKVFKILGYLGAVGDRKAIGVFVKNALVA